LIGPKEILADSLGREYDHDSLTRLQEMLGKGEATFKSPGQYHTYKKLLGRKTHLVSISGTGSGKTLPFQLAMWSWPEDIRGVMVLPYQVLHGDMKRRMEEVGLSCSKWEARKNANPSSRVVTMSIESFVSPTCTGWLEMLANSGKLGVVMFDEAHGVVEDAAFRVAYDASINQLMQLQHCVMLFCSATMSPHHMDRFWKVLKLKFRPGDCVEVIRSPTQRGNIFYQVLNFKLGGPPGKGDAGYGEWQEKWMDVSTQFIRALMSFLDVEEGERGLVFFVGDEECQLWGEQLECPYITGNVSSEQREDHFRRWRSGEQRILCLNKAGYYGFDFPSVRFAIMVGSPWCMTDFMQSSGRIGRDGEGSSCVVLLPFRVTQPKGVMAETFSGHKAIKHMLDGSGECLRYAGSEHMDGVGVRCSDLRAREGPGVLACGECYEKLGGEDSEADDVGPWSGPWGK
jgi:superfamily II DNA helicase RecQ